jgi:hypothetical protein
MGYYTRILTPARRIISVDEFETILKEQSLDASFSLDADTAWEWTSLVLRHKSGPEIAAIERNPVEPGSLGSEEIDGFLEEITDCKPASAAKWLSAYLPKVQNVYAFQWLRGTEVKNGGRTLGSVMFGMHKILGGVIQADGEGFSDDEQGDSILWQFSDGVKGPWRMTVLQDGKWVRFEMQLGDQSTGRRSSAAKYPRALRFWNETLPEGKREGILATDSQERAKLLSAIEQPCGRYPHWPLGQLVANAAGWADQDFWDAEYDKLLAAAQLHLS